MNRSRSKSAVMVCDGDTMKNTEFGDENQSGERAAAPIPIRCCRFDSVDFLCGNRIMEDFLEINQTPVIENYPNSIPFHKCAGEDSLRKFVDDIFLDYAF